MANFSLEPLQVTSRKDAFISYSRGDSLNFAIKLQEKLTEKGFKVWFDKQDIAPSVDWQEAIYRGIESADNFIFIIATKSVKSPYCGLEIERAIKYNKRLIPLVHLEPHECWELIPPDLSKINYIWFREDQDNWDESFNRLLSSLDQHKDYLELHTDLLLQALEWEKNQKQTNYLLIGEERNKAQAWLKQKFSEEFPIIPTDLHCEFISESLKNANNLMTQVFLAFSEQDEEIKEKIRKILLREGLTIWTNKTDIKAGKKFQEAIKKGIEGADNFIYLISSSSLKSEYCQQELDLAFSYNKRIIPLLIESLEPDLIPSSLRGLQFIDFTADYTSSVSKILGQLKKEPSYYEKQKILLVKALKWASQNQNRSLLLRGYNLQQFEAWLKVAQKREDYPPLALQEEFITASQNKSEETSLDVFISYSRADSDLARKINDELQEVGKTTWFDQESIATGDDFKVEIERGIKNSDNFVFIISPKSVNSPYCVEEVEYAQKLNKRFITILYRKLSEEDKKNLPPALGTCNLKKYHLN